jgi:hypothetical protein
MSLKNYYFVTKFYMVLKKDFPVWILRTRFEARNCISEPCPQDPYRAIFETPIILITWCRPGKSISPFNTFTLKLVGQFHNYRSLNHTPIHVYSVYKAQIYLNDTYQRKEGCESRHIHGSHHSRRAIHMGAITPVMPYTWELSLPSHPSPGKPITILMNSTRRKIIIQLTHITTI